MAILTRSDVDLYYEVHGSGPAILLTHGYSADTRMWAPNITALSATHQLILWDVRGHGRSSAPDDSALYSRDKTLNDMVALLDHLQVGQAVSAACHWVVTCRWPSMSFIQIVCGGC